MTELPAPLVRTLLAVAETRFYRPADDDDNRRCAALAAFGYIQGFNQGELAGYGMALNGTKFVRRRMGYER